MSSVLSAEVDVANEKSLGIVPLQPGTVEHDFAMLTKFQDYSAELLRLAPERVNGCETHLFTSLTSKLG